MAFQDYQLATNWNNAAGLANIETTFGSNFIAFALPINEGQPFERADVAIISLGRQTFEWRFAAMTQAQFYLIRSTYCANGYSGAVTARTLKNDGTMGNYSATLQVPHENTLEFVAGKGFLNVVIRFVVEAAL